MKNLYSKLFSQFSIQSNYGSVGKYSAKIWDYGITMLFYKAPFLVDIDVVQGKRVLKLEEISDNANAWHYVDLLIFNIGHWWSHTGSMQG
ncbi:unnamed protein product [Cochlearia groenlandica]